MKRKRGPTAVDALFSAGAALISVGVGLWLGLAAGLMAAGVCCLAASVLVDGPGQDGEGKGGEGG